MVSYFGGRCLLVEERERGVEPRQVLLLPSTKTSRARSLEQTANVIIDDAKVKNVGDAFIISTPGEYDVSQFAIRGTQVGEATVYVVDGNQLTFGLVSAPPGKELSDQELEAVGLVDVLAVPIPWSDEKDDPLSGLGKFVRAVEPSVVIPMTNEAKQVKAVVNELGTESEKVAKLNVTRKDLATEGFVIRVLEAQ